MESDDRSFEQIFRGNIPSYERLVEEVIFILKDIASRAHVKIHSVSGRVKDLNSTLEKIERKGYTNPWEQLEDVVGCRIVCLFISDLEIIEKEMMKEFGVSRREDKIEGGDDSGTFGYMSKHYICKLGPKLAGPRYDTLKDIKFEIQCRTLLMDAWANVSHYLAYKGSVSIPANLRRDFFALSGLFYVADKHFELFFSEAIAAEQNALSKASAGEKIDDDINLETVQALLVELYPDRERADRQSISSFVEEAAAAGYKTIGQLRSDLTRTADVALYYEANYPPGRSVSDKPKKEVKYIPGKKPKRGSEDQQYQDIGMARVSLGIVNPNYQPKNQDEIYASYRRYLQ
jgi:ppGpp synthetase/RelA/SpoT-type nucleotidyltranferase